MSDSSQGDGWWIASDGKWYPPAQGAGSAPTSPGPSFPPPDRATAPPAGRSTRSWSTTHVVLVGAVSLAVGAILGVVLSPSEDGAGSSSSASSSSPSTAERDPGVEVEESAGEGDEDEAPPPTEAAEERDLTVESGMTSGVDSIGTRYTSAGALVTNPNESLAAYDVDVLFNLMDRGGTVLDSDSANVPYIAPGATVPAVPLQIGFDVATEPSSIEVLVTGDLREDEGWQGVEFAMGAGIELEVNGAAVAAGSFGTELTAQVTNPSEDTVAELSIWACVLKRGGSVVGGEGSGISESIPPGATVSVNHPMTLDVAADEIICQATA